MEIETEQRVYNYNAFHKIHYINLMLICELRSYREISFNFFSSKRIRELNRIE